LGLVAQKGVHAAGFHPTAVIGALAAAAATCAALHAPAHVTAHALGIAGSMASGIIEYLTDGAWTKRMHAGWAAQSGLRAAAMAQAGFEGPLTVLEGRHGFFKAFAPSIAPDFGPLMSDLGQEWTSARLAFKPYACGTMTQPFIDCALALRARDVKPSDVGTLECPVGEGTVHRLWEPLDLKRRPPNAYAAKFSTPYCIAVAFVRGRAGLAEFTSEAVADPEVLAIAARVSYVVDPNDEYPQNYSGGIRARLLDGQTIEVRQSHLRGGAREPLPREELMTKCRANLRYGGATPDLADAIASMADALATNATPLDLRFLARAR
jgi:2-methylcitrate dehydratase PrpD